MKKLFFICVISLCYSLVGKAQTASATFYAKAGEKFWIYIDGAQMNNYPETRIKINGLTARKEKQYRVKILFYDNTLGSFEDNMSLYGVDGPMDLVYEIRLNKRNLYVMHLNSFTLPMGNTLDNGGGATVLYGVPNNNAGIIPSGDNNSQTVQKVVTTTTTIDPNGNNVNTNTNNMGVGVNMGTDGMNTNISVTDPNGNTTNMNMGVNIDPNNMGANTNINVNDPYGQNTQGTNSTTTKTVVTTTTTTTTGNTGTGNNVIYDNGGNQRVDNNMNNSRIDNDRNARRDEYKRDERRYPDNDRTKCWEPMSPADFQMVKSSIAKQSFAEEQLKVAKEITKVKCISAAQVKEIMGMFSFEANKLDYAKFAYDYTIDKSNYFTINDAFSFPSSVDELNKYIESRPKPNERKRRCNEPMSIGDFQIVKSAISKQSFAEEQLKVAKEVTQTKCISAAQVKEIMGLFSFEGNKLDYAKFAYDYAFDKDNYFMVNDAFSFSSSVDELTKYIDSKGR